MPTLPSKPPGAERGGPAPMPGSRPPRPAPEPGADQPGPAAGPDIRPPGAPPRPRTARTARETCPRETGRPLPDPAAVRLCAVPDSAPPYDGETLATDRAPITSPGDAGRSDADRPDAGRSDAGRPGTGDAGERREPPPVPAVTGGDALSQGTTPPWPSQFAQVLAETLAGSRPPRQIVPWTTERARSSIQRLGPTLTAGPPAVRQRPLVRRVVTSRPSRDVLEMTVIVGFGPRVRALAVRLERCPPRDTAPGHAARAPRWLCTAVEAA